MIFGVDSLYIWVAVIIIGVAVEAFSLNLSAIWFAVGHLRFVLRGFASAGPSVLPALPQDQKGSDQCRPHHWSICYRNGGD